MKSMAYHEQATVDTWLDEIEYQLSELKRLNCTHEFNLHIDSTKVIKAAELLTDMVDKMHDEIANISSRYIY
jgi:hypothetical protein